jgi:hypothetical protein
VFRIRPQRSSCQVASSGSAYVVTIGAPEEEPVEFWRNGCRERLTLGLAASVGNNWARASLTRARAERKLANAAATFWFEMTTCSSSAFNWELVNISHHFPRMTASLGWATFQMFVASGLCGVSSLNAVGVCTAGRWYLGAKLQPPIKTHPAPKTRPQTSPHSQARRRVRALKPRVSCMTAMSGEFSFIAQPKAACGAATPAPRRHASQRRRKRSISR